MTGSGCVQAVRVHAEGDEAMVSLGARLGTALEAGTTLTLDGPLGAGKTTLARGVLRALGHDGAVKSPTFTLVEPYESVTPPVYHFDLYRLGDPEELEFLGVDEYFNDEAVCLVEWPERGAGVLPRVDVAVTITGTGGGRDLSFDALSDRGARVLARIEAR